MRPGLISGLLAVAASVGSVATGCGDDSLPPASPAGAGGRSGNSGNVAGAGSSADAGSGGTDSDAGASSNGGAPEIEQGGAAGAALAGCNGDKKATITGRVFSPSGDLPLWGVTVFVPGATVDRLPIGPSCFHCDAPLPGSPVALATTDASGQFEIVNAPVGDDVPLVIQAGRWRRQIQLERVLDCQGNAVAETETRLPRNRSEGNVPRMAVVTGAEDRLECLLRKLGVDDSEFTADLGDERVQLFTGLGGSSRLAGSAITSFADASTLWSSLGSLASYDMVLLGSETDQNVATKGAAALQALRDYAAAGGRVLLQHHQGYFVQAGPSDLASVASFELKPDLPQPFEAKVDDTTRRGQALAEWLADNDPLSSPGSLTLSSGQNTLTAVSDPAVRLIYGESPATVQAFSVDLPYGAAGRSCGRVTFTDILSASGNAVDDFPDGCSTTALSPQERALAFLIFDLGYCL